MKTVLYKNIVADEAICGGRPILDGTRITVQTILGHLLAGDNLAQIQEAFPRVQPEDIETIKEFATLQLDRSFYEKSIV